MVELAEDARAVVHEIATRAASDSQEAAKTLESALAEEKVATEEMRLAARSFRRRSWIAVLLVGLLSSGLTLWLSGHLSLAHLPTVVR